MNGWIVSLTVPLVTEWVDCESVPLVNRWMGGLCVTVPLVTGWVDCESNCALGDRMD